MLLCGKRILIVKLFLILNTLFMWWYMIFFVVVDELQGLPPATKKNKPNKAKTPWKTKSRSSPPRNKV